jgi:hypothetical protein
MAVLPVNKRRFILWLFIYAGMRAVAFRIESFWADVQRLSDSCCASERPITNVATRWVLRPANLLWRVAHAELRNAEPNS